MEYYGKFSFGRGGTPSDEEENIEAATSPKVQGVQRSPSQAEMSGVQQRQIGL